MKKQFLFSKNVSCGSKIRGGQLSSDDDFDYLENLRSKKRRKTGRRPLRSESDDEASSPPPPPPSNLCSDVYEKLGFKPIISSVPLGQGGSGLVFRIQGRPDLVMKEQAVGTPDLDKDFNNEVRALTDLQGEIVSYNGQEWRIVPNIEASGICVEESMLAESGYSPRGYIVMEKLQPVREMTPEWKDKAYAVLERAKELGCLQVDVKKDNFMNNSDGNPMLIDWGWGWCSGWGEPTEQTYAHDYQDLMVNHGFLGLHNWQAFNVYDLLHKKKQS